VEVQEVGNGIGIKAKKEIPGHLRIFLGHLGSKGRRQFGDPPGAI
jgi:hypothetical protein